VKYLSHALENNTTLTILDLWKNRFGDEGIQYLTEALKTNKVRSFSIH